MGRLHLVSDAAEIMRRRKLVPAGQIVEAWPDLHVAGQYWMGATSKACLDEAGPPLTPVLSLDAHLVPIYYGSQLRDVESLPLEESLQTRVLSARGIAVTWITFDRFGERTAHEPEGPMDPVFFLRRPAATTAHVWRLFRLGAEARRYMAEEQAWDGEGREWAEALPAQTFEELIERHAVRGG
jgi:hypothetical protein